MNKDDPTTRDKRLKHIAASIKKATMAMSKPRVRRTGKGKLSIIESLAIKDGKVETVLAECNCGGATCFICAENKKVKS